MKKKEEEERENRGSFEKLGISEKRANGITWSLVLMLHCRFRNFVSLLEEIRIPENVMWEHMKMSKSVKCENVKGR